VARGVRPLRRRVRTSIVGVAALAVALFAVPLGYALAAGYRTDAVTNLQRESTRIAATVSDSFGTDGSTVALPRDLPGSLSVGVYRVDGTRIALRGPDRSPVAAAAADGHLHTREENGTLAVAAPVPSDGGVTLAVRVAQPDSALRSRILRAWALMGVLGAFVVGFAALLARRQARQIAHPLEQLTASAQALGDGNFAVHVARSGIAEADAAGVALEVTAQRLGELVDRERAFSAHVSHQLRTPLTALLLGLESALSRHGRDGDADLRAAAEAALRRAGQLQTTIEDLVALTRATGQCADPLDIPALLAGLRERWHATFAAKGRRLTLVTGPDLPAVPARPAAVRQILDVLLGNALVHGTGTASVAFADAGTGLSIEVSDEGPGLAADPEEAFARHPERTDGHGIGLALARSLAESEGGRLVVRRATPHPVFSLLLPLPPHTGSPDPAAS
jgi:signal transduction histidine kinase